MQLAPISFMPFIFTFDKAVHSGLRCMWLLHLTQKYIFSELLILNLHFSDFMDLLIYFRWERTVRSKFQKVLQPKNLIKNNSKPFTFEQEGTMRTEHKQLPWPENLIEDTSQLLYFGRLSTTWGNEKEVTVQKNGIKDTRQILLENFFFFGL